MEVSQAQIDEWEKIYGDVIVVEVAEVESELDPYKVDADLDEQKLVVGYLKPADDKVMNFALQKLPMFLEAGKVIVKNCWLGGDERLITEPDFLNGAAMQAAQLIKIRQGRLKKTSKRLTKFPSKP